MNVHIKPMHPEAVRHHIARIEKVLRKQRTEPAAIKPKTTGLSRQELREAVAQMIG